MTDTLDELLTELKDGLRGIYGDRLEGVFLFGSRARGDAEDDSDVDVLLVLDHVLDYGAEIARASEFVAALSLAHDTVVSLVFASGEHWLRRRTPFLINVRREAVPL
jgi:predicted nucleotidyltransferase